MMPIECRVALKLRVVLIAAIALPIVGCGPNYWTLRRQGQHAMLDGAPGAAKLFFIDAETKRPRRVENLHDLGACSEMLARERFGRSNHAAAMREIDDAIAYYGRALDVHPGHQASIEGKRVALKLKGDFDKALKHTEWAAEFVGPTAKQFLLLARELEERGDADASLLRYRQAVAVEPDSAEAHASFARFLLRNGNESAAVYHLQEAYRIQPTEEWVISELAKRGALPYLTSKDDPSP